MTTHRRSLDVIVVGAGPAGLTAAIYLARFKRTFALFHDGLSRAQWIPRTRNHPGFPGGVTGPDLLRLIQDQAEGFGAAVRRGVVDRVTPDGDGFQAQVDGQTLRARKIILATGVRDLLPDIPGAEEALRAGLLRICPICDGFEIALQPVAVIGEDVAAAREAMFLTTYSEAITLIHTGPPDALPRPERDRLDQAGIAILDLPVSSLSFDLAARTAVCATGSDRLAFTAVYSAFGVRPRSGLAIAAGARTADDGRLIVDEHQQTTLPGLFAAGDLVRGLNQISTAEGEAAIAATAIHNDLRAAEPPGARGRRSDRP